jgi:hypothetical protein
VPGRGWAGGCLWRWPRGGGAGVSWRGAVVVARAIGRAARRWRGSWLGPVCGLFRWRGSGPVLWLRACAGVVFQGERRNAVVAQRRAGGRGVFGGGTSGVGSVPRPLPADAGGWLWWGRAGWGARGLAGVCPSALASLVSRALAGSELDGRFDDQSAGNLVLWGVGTRPYLHVIHPDHETVASRARNGSWHLVRAADTRPMAAELTATGYSAASPFRTFCTRIMEIAAEQRRAGDHRGPARA